MVLDATGGRVVLAPGLEAGTPAPVVVPEAVVAATLVVVSPPVVPFSSAAVSSGVLASVPPPLPPVLEAQLEVVMVLSSSVTAAVCASSLPWIVAAVLAVIEADAMIVPTKCVPLPSVAEEPTCQKTLHACAPLTSETVVFEPVISVEPTWKMNTALGLPSALRVTLPEDSSSDSLAL